MSEPTADKPLAGWVVIYDAGAFDQKEHARLEELGAVVIRKRKGQSVVITSIGSHLRSPLRD